MQYMQYIAEIAIEVAMDRTEQFLQRSVYSTVYICFVYFYSVFICRVYTLSYSNSVLCVLHRVQEKSKPELFHYKRHFSNNKIHIC